MNTRSARRHAQLDVVAPLATRTRHIPIAPDLSMATRETSLDGPRFSFPLEDFAHHVGIVGVGFATIVGGCEIHILHSLFPKLRILKIPTRFFDRVAEILRVAAVQLDLLLGAQIV